MTLPRRVSSTAGKRLRVPDVLPLEKGNACTACRARKVRCDAGVPRCGTCLKMDPGVECEYVSKRPRRGSADYTPNPLTGGTRSASSARAATSEQAQLEWRAFVPPGRSTAEPSPSTQSSGSSNCASTIQRQSDAALPHHYTPFAPISDTTTSFNRTSSRPRCSGSPPLHVERPPSDSRIAGRPFYSPLAYDLGSPDLSVENYSVYDPPPSLPIGGSLWAGSPPDQDRSDQLVGGSSNPSPLGPPVDTTSEFERLLLGRPGFSGTRVEMDARQQMYGSRMRREGEWEYRRDDSGRR